MRVRFGGIWLADSEDVVLLFEPGRYPVAYFPETVRSSTRPGTHRASTQHPDLGPASWYNVRVDEQHVAPRGASQHTSLPAHASELQVRIAFAWRAMDASCEEDERIVGHATTVSITDVPQQKKFLALSIPTRKFIADHKKSA